MADGEVDYSFLFDKGTRKCLVTNCTVSLEQKSRFVCIKCTFLYTHKYSVVYYVSTFYSRFPVITCVHCLQVNPFPNTFEDQVLCSKVSNNCSAPSTLHEQNLSICCKYCSGQNTPKSPNPVILVTDNVTCVFAVECDFLTCPQHSTCKKRALRSVFCQCIEGLEEELSNGILSCMGKLY